MLNINCSTSQGKKMMQGFFFSHIIYTFLIGWLYKVQTFYEKILQNVPIVLNCIKKLCIKVRENIFADTINIFWSLRNRQNGCSTPMQPIRLQSWDKIIKYLQSKELLFTYHKRRVTHLDLRFRNYIKIIIVKIKRRSISKWLWNKAYYTKRKPKTHTTFSLIHKYFRYLPKSWQFLMNTPHSQKSRLDGDLISLEGALAHGRGWNLMGFKVPSKPNLSGILWVPKHRSECRIITVPSPFAEQNFLYTE